MYKLAFTIFIGTKAIESNEHFESVELLNKFIRDIAKTNIIIVREITEE